MGVRGHSANQVLLSGLLKGWGVIEPTIQWGLLGPERPVLTLLFSDTMAIIFLSRMKPPVSPDCVLPLPC